MKNYIKILMTALLFVTGSLNYFSVASQLTEGNVVTEKIKVTGVCGMCKTRIEETVMFLKGVKQASWDAQTQTLEVVYKSNKISKQEIGQALADAGHDNEIAKAGDEAYQELPGCCRYRDGIEVH